MITTQIDSDGIAQIIFQLNEQGTLVWSNELINELLQSLNNAINNADVKGIILRTNVELNKAGILFATDYQPLLDLTDHRSAMQYIIPTQQLLLRVDTSPKPIVAMMREAWVNLGTELAFACHHRIAVNRTNIGVGFPEVQYGLLPGGGGMQRLGRMIGLQAAATLLLRGTTLNAESAHKSGLINQLETEENIEAKCKEWIVNTPKPVKAWFLRNFQIPGGEVQSQANSQFMTAANASLRKQTWGNFMNKDKCLSGLYEGLQLPFNKALQVEADYFAQSVISHEFKSLINTMVLARSKAIQLSKRPAGIPVKTFNKVGVVGAGMMGAGIAFVLAQSGIETVLIDSSDELATRGKAFTEKQLDKLLQKQTINEEVKNECLNRINATTDYNQLKDCDLVIETVTEDKKIKADVTKLIEAVIADSCIIASNTSTLPITGLAKAVKKQERFVGIHFFSPVHRMPLIEIIKGKKTSEECLAHALDFTRKLNKTPIVVNDGRGFFTTRVFETYVLEGMALVSEGVEPAVIENAARMAGMPVGPLALADEVSIELMAHIVEQAKAELGKAYKPHSGEPVIDLMMKKLKRSGRKSGKGFYDYPKDGAKYLWPELSNHFKPAKKQPDPSQVQDRLLLIQCIEAVKAVEEGIIDDHQEADLGSVLGIGFPAFKAGVLGHLKNLGYDEAVKTCKELAKQVDNRFTPPKTLLDWAKA